MVEWETYRLSIRALEQLKNDYEAAWAMLLNCYDVEPREYFEREASINGFRSPLAQAIFHIHKRDRRGDEAHQDTEG
jgi:hypothetical protein